SGLMTWTVVPNFRVLGPRLGPKVNEVKAALAAADGTALQRQLESEGFIEVAGERLTADDVELRASRHEAYGVAEDGGWAVALDLELDDELRREGLARELVRSLNELRKDLGLEVSDRIRLTVEAEGPVAEAVVRHRDYAAGEVLAVELDLAAVDGRAAGELDVDGHRVRVAVEKACRPNRPPARAPAAAARGPRAARRPRSAALAAPGRIALDLVRAEHRLDPLAGAAGGLRRRRRLPRRGRRAERLVLARAQLGRQPGAAVVARHGEGDRLGRRAGVD